MANKNIVALKLCEKGHVLGQVRENGSGLHIFELFRQAIDYGADIPDQVDLIAVIHGRATDVRCSICSAVIVWHAGRRRAAQRVAFE